MTAVESLVDPEELYRGTIAKEIVEGIKAPLLDYQADPYDGGSLVMGILAAPLFRVLGPSLFVLKLVPLAFSFGTLLLLLLFLRRFFDEPTAFLGGLLLTLSPPNFTALSLTAIGSHTESIFFSILILYCFYRFTFEENHSLFWSAAFGLAAGTGCWFTSITGITVLACLLSWFLMGCPGRSQKAVLFFCGALFAGLLPFISYNLSHRFRGIRFVLGVFSWGYSDAHSLLYFPRMIFLKLIQLVSYQIPQLLNFEPAGKIPASFFAIFYYGLSACGIIFFYGQEFVQWIRKKSGIDKTLPLLLYPVIFLAAYGLSYYEIDSIGSSVDSRYLIPLQFFSLILLALGVRRMKERRIFFYCGFAFRDHRSENTSLPRTLGKGIPVQRLFL